MINHGKIASKTRSNICAQNVECVTLHKSPTNDKAALIPVEQCSIPYVAQAATYFLKLHHLAGFAWLDSANQSDADGRWDIFTALPSTTLNNPPVSGFQQTVTAHLNKYNHTHSAPFCGGWLGFVGYEFLHPSVGIPQKSEFLCSLGWYDWALVLDHKTKTAELIFLPECTTQTKQRVEQALSSPTPTYEEFKCSPFVTDEPKSHYLQCIERIQEYILAGDCYQTNYTQRFSAQCSGSSAAAYLALREATPNPFCAYLSLPNKSTIFSLSQERFVQIKGRNAKTQPIKGTAPTSDIPKEDEHTKQELKNSAKNRAENLMIVDLLRNDFSKNCLPNSVITSQLFDVQSYKNVHHLVSTIEGILKPEVSHANFLLDCFPGGSITGAPKKRAMEIIQELESHPREVYCGCIGYFSTNGNTDFNISIRTLLRQHNLVHCWAGGGIVADSTPEHEYQESLQKIAILLEALSGTHLHTQ